MTFDISDIRSAVKKVAWGFFFIYIHINIGTIDILPDWAGYALMVSALTYIALEQESAKLLRPLGTALVVWSVIEWVLKIFGLQIYLNYLSVIPTVLNLYFTFQLFTNLAGIADKYFCPQGKRLLVLRTVNVIFTVANALLLYAGILIYDSEIYMIVMMALLAVAFILMLAILITLFGLSSSMGKIEEEMLKSPPAIYNGVITPDSPLYQAPPEGVFPAAAPPAEKTDEP